MSQLAEQWGHLRRSRLRWQAVFIVGLGLSLGASLQAKEAPSPEAKDLEQPWLKPILVPADLELEQQIVEVQEALSAIHKQIVRRKELVKTTQEPTTKATLYEELDTLQKERVSLEAILNELVEEAKASEQTAIDEALAHARWLERQQEYQQQKEEIIRDRQP